MARPVTVQSINSNIVKQMKALGTYCKEFETIIDIFAGMVYQYQNLSEEYAARGYPHIKQVELNAIKKFTDRLKEIGKS